MDITARINRLAKLLEDRLDLRGDGLQAKLARAERRLPRHIRAELDAIVEAETLSAHPRLSRQIDHARLARRFDAVEHYLRNVSPWERRGRLLQDWLAGQAVNALLLAALVYGLLRWRGYL